MQSTGLQHLSRLSDAHLLEATASLVRQRDAQTAVIVTHLAIIAERKAYRPLGYSSLHSYCVYELHLSEHSAYKHVWAVRFALRFPPVLDAIAAGHVHLAGVCELARYITPENAADLLEAAKHRTRQQIQAMLVERFPKPDLPTLVVALPSAAGPEASTDSSATTAEDATRTANVRPETSKLAPGQVLDEDTQNLQVDGEAPAPASSAVHTPASHAIPVAASSPDGEPASSPARIAPSSPGRYAVQVTISQRAHDLLRRAQALLAHSRPGSNVADVLEVALEQLVCKLESRKFSDTDRPSSRRASGDSRRVPAEVRRQVAARDGKRCTFESDGGKRCEETALLEYDHVIPVARGGRGTVDNVRLRCRAHNQLAAEQVFGEGFMREKRERAHGSARYTKARAS